MDLYHDLKSAADALRSWDGAELGPGIEALERLEQATSRATAERTTLAEIPVEEGTRVWFELLRLGAAATASLLDLAVAADEAQGEQAESLRLAVFRAELATATLFRLTAAAMPGGAR
jgi:hypothetical protein